MAVANMPLSVAGPPLHVVIAVHHCPVEELNSLGWVGGGFKRIGLLI